MEYSSELNQPDAGWSTYIYSDILSSPQAGPLVNGLIFLGSRWCVVGHTSPESSAGQRDLWLGFPMNTRRRRSTRVSLSKQLRMDSLLVPLPGELLLGWRPNRYDPNIHSSVQAAGASGPTWGWRQCANDAGARKLVHFELLRRCHGRMPEYGSSSGRSVSNRAYYPSSRCLKHPASSRGRLML